MKIKLIKNLSRDRYDLAMPSTGRITKSKLLEKIKNNKNEEILKDNSEPQSRFAFSSFKPKLLHLVWLIYFWFNAFKPQRWCEKKLLTCEMGIFQRNGYRGQMLWEAKEMKGAFYKMVLSRRDRRVFYREMGVLQSYSGMRVSFVTINGEEMGMLQSSGKEGLLTGYVGLFMIIIT